MRFRFRVQRALSHVCLPVVGLGVWAALRARGLRIAQMGAVRRRFAEITSDHSGPLLICSNHLTMVDSAIVIWGMASFWSFFWRPRRLPWNVPEKEHVAHSLFLRLLCYLAKSITIERQGSIEHRREVTEQLLELLASGETVALFPEGRRSRTGRLDTEEFGYGVGELATRTEGVRIICMYARGSRQGPASTVPPKNDLIHAELCVVEPETAHRGRRAAREVSRQVITALEAMEQRYFSEVSSLVSASSQSDTLARCEGA